VKTYLPLTPRTRIKDSIVRHRRRGVKVLNILREQQKKMEKEK